MREELIALGEQIAEQAVHLDAAMNRLLLNLHTFDERGGWQVQGFQSCAHWLSWRVGWDLTTSRDRVRVAHQLAGLPKVQAAMEAGEVSYSKVRAIARVATPQTEETLLTYAEYAPAAQLEKICQKLKMVEQVAEAKESGKRGDPEERYVQTRSMGDGMVCVKAVLRPEEAAMLMQVIQVAARSCKEEADPKRPPNRADGLMAVIQGYARGAQQERTPIEVIVTIPASGPSERVEQPAASADFASSADFTVSADSADSTDSADFTTSADSADFTVSADSAETRTGSDGALERSPRHAGASILEELNHLPSLSNGDFVSAETARRLSCDAGLVEVEMSERGVPLSVGRRTRTIPAAIKRALLVRDKTCRFPGCGNRLFLDGHHIKHWADGGETSLNNLALLCSSCHARLHEHGYSMEMKEPGALVFRDQRGEEIPATGERPRMDFRCVGWPTITKQNEGLDLHAETSAPKWNGRPVNYPLAVNALFRMQERGRAAPPTAH